jgi:heat shock protein HtpX
MAGVSFAEYDKVFRQTKKTRQGVIPPSATKAEAEAEDFAAVPLAVIAAATTPRPDTPDRAKRRAREVDDFFYRQNDYRALTCPCGTTLKVPPGFLATRINCPRCERQHNLADFQPLPVREENQSQTGSS